MEKILKKAGLSNTSKVIGAATDVKNKSIKRMWNVFFGGMFFGLGLLCLYGVLWSTTLIFTEPFGFVILGYLFGLASKAFHPVSKSLRIRQCHKIRSVYDRQAGFYNFKLLSCS